MKFSDNGVPIQSGRGLQQVKEQIEKEFAKVRDRRRVNSGAERPLYNRRKDDKPTADPVVERFQQMLDAVAEPEVELVDLDAKPLAELAGPLLAAIGGSDILRKTTPVHEINEVFEGDLNLLFAQAEASLGFRKPDVDGPNLSAQSIWTRRIRLRKKDR